MEPPFPRTGGNSSGLRGSGAAAVARGGAAGHAVATELGAAAGNRPGGAGVLDAGSTLGGTPSKPCALLPHNQLLVFASWPE